MKKNEFSTKEKILKSANTLFAEYGYSGASVREIAKNAGVNLSAVNYHFENKENLYWSVFDYNYDFLDQGVSEIGKRTNDTHELTKEVFRFFMSDKAAMMNTFKIFLAEGVKKPKNFVESDKFGPPGESAFLEKIESDLKKMGLKKNHQDQINWVNKMIFSHLVHFSVILNTSVMSIKGKKDKSLSPREIEKTILKGVSANLNFVKDSLKK